MVKFDDICDEVFDLDLNDIILLYKMLGDEIHKIAKKENRCPHCGEYLSVNANYSDSCLNYHCPNCGEI